MLMQHCAQNVRESVKIYLQYSRSVSRKREKKIVHHIGKFSLPQSPLFIGCPSYHLAVTSPIVVTFQQQRHINEFIVVYARFPRIYDDFFKSTTRMKVKNDNAKTIIFGVKLFLFQFTHKSSSGILSTLRAALNLETAAASS